MSDDVDVDKELLLVGTLGVALRMIRQKLDGAAVERVVRYSLERAGIHVSTHLIVGPSPFAAGPPEQPAPTQVQPQDFAALPPTARPIKQDRCPICSYAAMNARGLVAHMHKKHGTTPKEYARQQQLDAEQKASDP